MIQQTSWRRDQHVDTAEQLRILVVERNAANDQRDVELVVLAVFLEMLCNLRSKLPRWLENERARHARTRASFLEHCQHRQHECSGLAGAGLRNAEHIASREHVRDSLVLDGGGSFVASRFDGG